MLAHRLRSWTNIKQQLVNGTCLLTTVTSQKPLDWSPGQCLCGFYAGRFYPRVNNKTLLFRAWPMYVRNSSTWSHKTCKITSKSHVFAQKYHVIVLAISKHRIDISYQNRVLPEKLTTARYAVSQAAGDTHCPGAILLNADATTPDQH